MEYNNSFQELIESIVAARKSKNLTQAELGKRLGLPQSYISKFESGRIDVRLSSIIEIARFLNLELMLVPNVLVPTVQALAGTREFSSNKPLYSLDNDGGDTDDEF